MVTFFVTFLALAVAFFKTAFTGVLGSVLDGFFIGNSFCRNAIQLSEFSTGCWLFYNAVMHIAGQLGCEP